jgi:hypothetical protein
MILVNSMRRGESTVVHMLRPLKRRRPARLLPKSITIILQSTETRVINAQKATAGAMTAAPSTARYVPARIGAPKLTG